MGTAARAHVRAPFPFFVNGWTGYAEIWYAVRNSQLVRNQLARQLTQTNGGSHLHMRTCVSLFRISGAAGRIVLKFAMWVERFTSYACYKVMDGVPISARVQSRGSQEHSAEMWCAVRPINYES